MESMKVRITFTREMLGTCPASKDIYDKFIAKQCPIESQRRQEVETIEAKEEQGLTVFHSKDGKCFLYDYVVKGFFKAACQAMSKADDSKSKDLKAFRKEIDLRVFAFPRELYLTLPANAATGLCQRPLRASTPQGERVALASSETVPEGTFFEVEIKFLQKSLKPYIIEWLNYGELSGFGQWRNSGAGRFSWVELKDEKK